jgi:hypothetical protein
MPSTDARALSYQWRISRSILLENAPTKGYEEEWAEASSFQNEPKAEFLGFALKGGHTSAPDGHSAATSAIETVSTDGGRAGARQDIRI